MKKSKLIAIVLVAAVMLSSIGFIVYDKVTTVDFGEIVIDGIPEKN